MTDRELQVILSSGEVTEMFMGGTGAGDEVLTDSEIDALITANDLTSTYGVFAALDVSGGAVDTTITVASTFYPILGTFSNSPSVGFTGVATPAIRYDGTATTYFEIDYHATLAGDSNGITAKIGVKKNGSLDDNSVMATYLKTSGEVQLISGTYVCQLATNDTIQLVCTADGAGDVLSFHNFTTTIKRFIKS